MKLYVIVETFRGIVQDVHLCKTEEEADELFEKITGMKYDELYVDGICTNEDWDQSLIFVLDYPDVLKEEVR